MAGKQSPRRRVAKRTRGGAESKRNQPAKTPSSPPRASAQKRRRRGPASGHEQTSEQLLLAISRVQALFIDEAEPSVVFGVVLRELLTVTASQYGFIGEVHWTAEQQPFLRTHAISDIAWNAETKALMAQHAPTLEFRNLKTLFGHVMTTGKPVIANDPAHDPRAGELPPGHPPMHAFLGLPLYRKDKLTGMVGIANRSGGYDGTLVAYLEPFLSTCAQLLEGYHHRQQRQKVEAALRESEERWQLAVRGSNDGIWDWNILAGKVFFSVRWKQMRGWEEWEGTDSLQEWKDGIHPEDFDRVMERVEAYLTKRVPEFCEEYRVRRKDGSYFWILDRGVALWDAQGVAIRMAGSESDITERKRHEAFLAAEKQALELVAKGAGLSEVLTFICRAIEAHTTPMLTSVMLVTEDGGHLCCVAAPNLPEDYNRAVDGIPIGPTVGSCGSAAYFGKPVIVSDIETDLLWKDYVQLTKVHGLRACWSQPIFSSTGTVLGTFAAYYHEPRIPSPAELAVVERAGHLAAMAIQHIKISEALRESEARFHAFMTHSPAVSFIKDSAGRHLYINPTFERLFGVSLDEIRGKTLEGRLPSEVEAQLRENDEKVLASGQPIEVEETVPTPDGKSQHWLALKFPLTSSSGELLLGGKAIDITERKRLEQASQCQADRLRLAMDIAGVATWDWNILTNQVTWSDNCEQVKRLPVGSFDGTFEAYQQLVHPEDLPKLLGDIDRALSGQVPYHTEHRIVSPTGEVQWIEGNGAVYRDEQGRPIRMVGTVWNITERKRIEQLMRVNEERYARATTVGRVGVWELDVRAGTYYGDRSLKVMFGYQPDELSTDPLAWLDLVHPDDRPRALAQWQRIMGREADDYNYELRMIRKDGTIIWTDVRGHAVRDDDGQVTHLIGATLDITDRKRAESVLAQKEEHLRIFIEHSPVSLAMLDQEMRYLAVSRRWRAEYRVGDQPLIGRSHYEVFPEIPERWRAIHRRCLAGAVEGCEEDPFVRADGRTDWSRWEIRPWRTGEGDVGGIVIFSEDITARKQAEAALRESEERFRVIADTVPALLWMAGVDKGCSYFNTRWLDYTGRTIDQELGNGWVEGVHPDDLDHCMGIYLEAFDSHQPFEMEYRLRKADGQYGWIHDSGVPRFLPDGTFGGYLGACIDITARKQAEELSRRSEAFVSSVIEHLPHMVFVKEAQGLRFMRLNKAGEALLGTTRDALLGKTDYDLFPHSQAEFFTMKDREVLSQGGLVDIAEETIQTIYGPRTLHTKKVPIYGEDGCPQYLLGISEDITARRQVEERLQRTQFAMDQAVDAVYWIDAEARILYANEAASAMLGYTSDEFLRMAVHDLNPHFPKEVWPGWWAETRQKKVMSLETVHLTKDGRQIPVDIRVSFLAHGGQEFHCAFVRDISERKRVEAARETLQYAVDRGMEGFALLDAEGRYTYMNEAHASIYGAQASDLIGRSWRILYDEAEITRIETEVFPILQAKGTWHGELIGRTNSGASVYAEVGLQRLPQSVVLPEVMLCTCRDITERKRAEEEQLRMRTLLTNVINTTPDLVLVKDRQLRTLLCNEPVARMIGKAPGELVGYTDIENGWDPELVLGNSDKGIRGYQEDDLIALSGQVVHNPQDLARVNGVTRTYDTYKVPLRDERGDITGILGIARDVTERKWMEDALHALVRGTGAVTGEAFFSVFVKELALALHMQYAAVADLQSDQADRITVRAMWNGTSIGQPFSYPSTGTPCEVAICEGVVCYPSGVRCLFPNDLNLVKLQAESYLGILLRSQTGHALGHIFVIDSNPLPDPTQALTILQIFAARAAAELERIKIDEALRASEERFALAVRGTNDGIWDWDILRGTQYWSDRHFALFGLEPQAFGPTYAEWIALVHPEDADLVHRATQHHLETREPYDVEVRVRMKNGSYRWFHDRGQAVWDDTGRPMRMVGSISDVTDRKAVHEQLEQRVVERTTALRRSEQRYAGLVNSAHGIILEVDGETYRIIFASRQAERILGYPVEQWLDDPMFWLNHVHPDDQQWALTYRQDMTKQGRNHELEYRMVASDGRIVWIRDSVSVLCDDDGNLKLSCILLDVTKHQEMVDRLQLTQYAVDQASDQIFVIGPDGYFRDVNESACRRLGYSKAELLTMSVMDIDPDFPVGVWDSFWAEFATAKRVQLETRHRSKSGEIYPVEVVANYLFRDGKELDYAIVRDITDRKRHETALLESEERFSKAFNESPIGMALVAIDGRWLQVNQALCEIVGYSKTELESTTFQAITHPDDLMEDLAGIRQLLDGGLRAYQMEKRYIHRNGSIVWILLNVSLVRNVDGTPKHFISQIQDITERKHLQDQAVRYLEELERQVEERTAEIATLESRRAQTEKLAALGRLAAGVAHEINNPMAGIKNAFTLVRQAVDPAHPSAEFAGLIDREIARVSSIIQNMYQLCRPESRAAELVDLCSLAKDLEVLLTPQLQQRRLKFIVEMEHCPTRLCVPRGDLVQVLLNLLTNSIDCSPEGETITLGLQEEGQWVRLAVRDQGPGIDSEHLPRIFDPFYTTKVGRDQKGMGLGLSVSQSLVQAMGGKIEVETWPGRGSIFTVFLPSALVGVNPSVQSNIIKEVVTHDR